MDTKKNKSDESANPPKHHCPNEHKKENQESKQDMIQKSMKNAGFLMIV